MTLKDLRKRINVLGITPNDELRAAYYIKILENLNTQFQSIPEDAAITGGDESKKELIQQAFQKENLIKLLNTYGNILDNVIHGGLNAEIQAQYAKNRNHYTAKDAILNGLKQTNYIQKFYTEKYPFLGVLSSTIEQNAIKNLKRLAERVIGDIDGLRQVFDIRLKSLVQISGTGSDLHKGGQQVLFLTFDTTSGSRVKLVYKPSDLESDCLIVGDSIALGKVDPVFFGSTKSFYELINEEIKKRPDYDATQKKGPFLLPTYKFLPKNYGSSINISDLRKSYGYIEFVSSEKEKANYTGSYGIGNAQVYSDYNIKDEADVSKIAGKFYTLVGQITPITTLLSMADVHHENVITHNYEPYLIDLEVSLLRNIPINKVNTTGFYKDGLGRYEAQTFGLKNIASAPQPEVYVRSALGKEPTRNRLWHNNQLIDTQPYITQIASGVEFTIEAINSMQASTLNNWIQRVEKSTVRYVIYATVSYISIYQAILFEKDIITKFSINDGSFKDTMHRVTNTNLKAWERGLTTGDDDDYGLRFLGQAYDYVSPDYANGDIPAFYHKLSTNKVVDSNGKTLSLPTQLIDYKDQDGNPKKLNLTRTEINKILTTNNKSANVRESNDEFFKTRPFSRVTQKLTTTNSLTGEAKNTQITEIQQAVVDALGIKNGQDALKKVNFKSKLKKDLLNVVGESHNISGKQRPQEKAYIQAIINSDQYWQEGRFRVKPNDDSSPFADPFKLRVAQDIAFIVEGKIVTSSNASVIYAYANSIAKDIRLMEEGKDGLELTDQEKIFFKQLQSLALNLLVTIKAVYPALNLPPTAVAGGIIETSGTNSFDNPTISRRKLFEAAKQGNLPVNNGREEPAERRSKAMHKAAEANHTHQGVWKIGQKHLEDIQIFFPQQKYNLISSKDFYTEFNEWVRLNKLLNL